MAGVKTVKVTVVGDGFVGKTCLLIYYTEREFSDTYIPTVFENYAQTKELDGISYNLKLWDTAGQEDYERLRPLSYPNTTCFLVCFSIDNQTTLSNVVQKWIPEVRHYMPHSPCILVGTKGDLRNIDNPNLILITTKEINKAVRQVKAHSYYECSAKNGTGVDEIIEAAIRASSKNKKSPTRHCTLL